MTFNQTPSPWLSKLLNDLEKDTKEEELQRIYAPRPPLPVKDSDIIDEENIVEESQVIVEIDIS